jgi:hypothetical protein
MTFIGVDPHWAKPYAVTVLLENGLIVRQDSCNLEFLYGLVKSAMSGGETVVAIEDQYMNKNYSVAKKLSWSAGKVMGAAELAGALTVTVNVATWKARMGAQKGRHVEVSVSMGGAPDDDLASSHLIAEHARRSWTG